MQKLLPVFEGIHAVTRWTAKIASYMVLAMVAFMTLEVVLRYGFNSPTNWVHEVTQYTFGTYFMLGAAWTLQLRGHVNMDIFYNRLSPRTRAILDVFTASFFFFFIGLMLWKGGILAWESIIKLDTSPTVNRYLLYPVKMVIPVAAVFILLEGTVKFITDLHIAFTGESVREVEEPKLHVR